MMASARARLLPRVAGRDVLLIQDTTSLRDRACPRALVPGGNKRGVYLHPTIAVDATDGALSGLLSADVLIRVHHDRLLRDGGTLCEAGAILPGSPTLIVEVPAVPGRAARTACLTVRTARVHIRRPKRNRAHEARALPESAALTLVEVHEDSPPPGEPALRWRLLTSHTVTSLADVKRIVGFYRRRWDIEQVFRVMKTRGFDVEAAPFEENAPLANLACAILIAAIHIQQMLHDRDGLAGRPMEDAFAPEDRPIIVAIGRTLEGHTVRQRNPHPPDTLAHAGWICARLGGRTGYYGKPGPIVLVKGYARLMAMIEGVKRFGLV
jgi:hypothetical protein